MAAAAGGAALGMPHMSDASAQPPVGAALGMSLRSDASAQPSTCGVPCASGSGVASMTGAAGRADASIGAATWTGGAATYPVCLVDGDCPREFGGDEAGVVVLGDAEAAFPLYLAGEDAVRLDHGDCALVPARSSARAGAALGDAATNGAAAVWAADGEWLGHAAQMILVANWSTTDVAIDVGEIVGAVLRRDAAIPIASAEPEVAHVQEDWDELRGIVEIDVPCDAYYDLRAEFLRKRVPRVSATLLEHLLALKGMLDVCITAGYSMGAEKSLDRLAQPALEAFGEIVGREGSEACER